MGHEIKRYKINQGKKSTKEWSQPGNKINPSTKSNKVGKKSTVKNDIFKKYFTFYHILITLINYHSILNLMTHDRCCSHSHLPLRRQTSKSFSIYSFARGKNKQKIRSHLGPVPQVSGRPCEAKPEAKSPCLHIGWGGRRWTKSFYLRKKCLV